MYKLHALQIIFKKWPPSPHWDKGLKCLDLGLLSPGNASIGQISSAARNDFFNYYVTMYFSLAILTKIFYRLR